MPKPKYPKPTAKAKIIHHHHNQNQPPSPQPPNHMKKKKTPSQIGEKERWEKTWVGDVEAGDVEVGGGLGRSRWEREESRGSWPASWTDRRWGSLGRVGELVGGTDRRWRLVGELRDEGDEGAVRWRWAWEKKKKIEEERRKKKKPERERG